VFRRSVETAPVIAAYITLYPKLTKIIHALGAYKSRAAVSKQSPNGPWKIASISFPTVPMIIRDGEAAGDTCERIMLGDLGGKQRFQQLPDGNDL
jgi:hypothetical protein